MKICRKLILIKYWSKILKSQNIYIKAVYSMLRSDADADQIYGGLNWAYQIRLILNESGLSNLWLNQCYIDSMDYKVIKQRILDIYKQSCILTLITQID